MDALSQGAAYNIGVDHHAVLGVLAYTQPDGSVRLLPSDQGMLDAFRAVSPALLPPRMKVMLSGHAHLWEQLAYSSGHPSQFIDGFSGSDTDLVPLPPTIAQGTPLPTGAVVKSFSSWVGDFGFMTFERSGPASWDVTVWDRNGSVRNRCTVEGADSRCSVAQIASPLHRDTRQ